MTAVRRFFPEVRLKKMLAEPGGVRAAEALASAEQNLDDIKADALVAVDAKIAQLEALVSDGGEAAIERSYYLANEIFAEAGAFKLAEVSEAAHSLCTLIAAADTAPVPKSAFMVHVTTLRALRSKEVSASEALRAAVLAELRALTAKIAAAR